MSTDTNNQKVDCESNLLWPIFMFFVRQLPLVAVVVITVAKEEVKRSGIKSNKVLTGRRLVMVTADRVNQKST